MTRYINIDERWGDPVEVEADDYATQAMAYGETVIVEERLDGLYIDGKMVARVADDDLYSLADDHEADCYEDEGETAYGCED